MQLKHLFSPQKKSPISYYYNKLRLLSEIEETKRSMELAFSNFENNKDPELIDCAIYELKAAQLRYEFLLSRAKEYDMTCLYDQVIS